MSAAHLIGFLSQVFSNPGTSGTDLAGLRHRAQQNDAMAAPAAYPHDDWMFSASKWRKTYENIVQNVQRNAKDLYEFYDVNIPLEGWRVLPSRSNSSRRTVRCKESTSAIVDDPWINGSGLQDHGIDGPMAQVDPTFLVKPSGAHGSQWSKVKLVDCPIFWLWLNSYSYNML